MHGLEAHAPDFATIDGARLRELVRGLDVLTEDDLTTLADVKPGTAEAWRKRGTGPAYVRLGNRYLYPRAAVAEFLLGKAAARADGRARASSVK